MSAGLFGLMDAIDAFDLDRKVKFETYCAPCIRGAILDELRSMDWVPRLVRSRSARVDAIRQTIEKATGQPATDDQVAAALSIPADEFDKLMRDGGAVATRSLTQRCFPSDGIRTCEKSMSSATRPRPTRWATSSAETSRTSSPRACRCAERLIVVLYYYEGMTMKETARTLDLSESRVSQMHSSILARLKSQMQHRERELEPVE